MISPSSNFPMSQCVSDDQITTTKVASYGSKLTKFGLDRVAFTHNIKKKSPPSKKSQTRVSKSTGVSACTLINHLVPVCWRRVCRTHPELFTTVAHELLVQASGGSLLSHKGNAESDEGEELDHG